MESTPSQRKPNSTSLSLVEADENAQKASSFDHATALNISRDTDCQKQQQEQQDEEGHLYHLHHLHQGLEPEGSVMSSPPDENSLRRERTDTSDTRQPRRKKSDEVESFLRHLEHRAPESPRSPKAPSHPNGWDEDSISTLDARHEQFLQRQAEEVQRMKNRNSTTQSMDGNESTTPHVGGPLREVMKQQQSGRRGSSKKYTSSHTVTTNASKQVSVTTASTYPSSVGASVEDTVVPSPDGQTPLMRALVEELDNEGFLQEHRALVKRRSQRQFAKDDLDYGSSEGLRIEKLELREQSEEEDSDQHNSDRCLSRKTKHSSSSGSGRTSKKSTPLSRSSEENLSDKYDLEEANAVLVAATPAPPQEDYNSGAVAECDEVLAQSVASAYEDLLQYSQEHSQRDLMRQGSQRFDDEEYNGETFHTHETRDQEFLQEFENDEDELFFKEIFVNAEDNGDASTLGGSACYPHDWHGRPDAHHMIPHNNNTNSTNSNLRVMNMPPRPPFHRRDDIVMEDGAFWRDYDNMVQETQQRNQQRQEQFQYLQKLQQQVLLHHFEQQHQQRAQMQMPPAEGFGKTVVLPSEAGSVVDRPPPNYGSPYHPNHPTEQHVTQGQRPYQAPDQQQYHHHHHHNQQHHHQYHNHQQYALLPPPLSQPQVQHQNRYSPLPHRSSYTQPAPNSRPYSPQPRAYSPHPPFPHHHGQQACSSPHQSQQPPYRSFPPASPGGNILGMRSASPIPLQHARSSMRSPIPPAAHQTSRHGMRSPVPPVSPGIQSQHAPPPPPPLFNSRTPPLSSHTPPMTDSPLHASAAQGHNMMLPPPQPVQLPPRRSTRSPPPTLQTQQSPPQQIRHASIPLTIDERACVNTLRAKWEARKAATKARFTYEWYLRFARCSPGAPFNFFSAWKVMMNFAPRYLDLSIVNMEQQLKNNVLFPVKGLQSSEGHDMFYMRPARYFPRKEPIDRVIDNLVYVMQCMLEDEHNSRNGIGFIANMTDWKMSNFSIAYCHKFLMTLQGRRVPTRVQIFLIVNPPSWFGSIWAIMRTMMSDAFRKRVRIISFDAMPDYLAPCFEEHLPDDMIYGMVDTDQMVQEFIAERKHIESNRILNS